MSAIIIKLARKCYYCDIVIVSWRKGSGHGYAPQSWGPSAQTNGTLSCAVDTFTFSRAHVSGGLRWCIYLRLISFV